MAQRKRYTRHLGRRLREPLPARTTREWVRFEHRDEPFGVFTYLRRAAEALGPEARAEMERLREWFNRHLDAPEQATHERFWFRAEAAGHADQARRLARLVQQAGFPIVERRTRRVPGRVSWEDEHQVAVFTFRDTPRPRR